MKRVVQKDPIFILTKRDEFLLGRKVYHDCWDLVFKKTRDIIREQVLVGVFLPMRRKILREMKYLK